MAHTKIGNLWLVKRVCRHIKGRPRCAESYEIQDDAQVGKQMVLGHCASPFADLIQKAWCFEVVIFFIIVAGFRPVSLSALNLSCTHRSKVCKNR